jgi:hypothetical protein
MPNNKPPRDKMPSAHDIAEELLKEVVEGERRHNLEDEDTQPDIPIHRHPVKQSDPPELLWIERRIGKSVIWGIKAIVVSALIFVGSAMGSVLWSWITRK